MDEILQFHPESKVFTTKDGATFFMTEGGGIKRQKGKSTKTILKDEEGVETLFQAKQYILKNCL